MIIERSVTGSLFYLYMKGVIEMTKISNAIQATKGFMGKHSPEILTGIGVTGMITSTVLAVKATPKALQLIEDAKNNEDIVYDKLPVKTVVKVAWKPYIPAVTTGIASIVCIVWASAVNTKRNAALAAAYTISERTLNRYKDKVIETIGEKKEKEIREQISQDKIDEKTNAGSQVIITSKGSTLCLDSISGRLFKSDIDQIRKAVNELNREMTYQNYIALNDLYSAIGLEPIKTGYDLGWNIDDGLIDLEFDACLSNDEPCLVIDYSIKPKYDYNRMG